MGKEETSEFVSEEEMLVIAERSLGTSDFQLEKFEARPASEHPMGFLGAHAKVRARVRTQGGVRELHYFVKKIPSAVPEHFDYAVRTRAFYKEIEMYKTLFADMKKATAGSTKWCPEYYYSRGHETLVTEDLSADGYYMLPERSLMDEEHVKASLKAMAAMHAASFILEQELGSRPEAATSPAAGSLVRPPPLAVGDLYPHLTFETEASDLEGHPGNTYYEAGIRSQLRIVDLLPGLSPSQKEEVKARLPGILRRMMQLVKTSREYKNVFVHGDPWANNLLFRKEPDGRIDALLVDFQLARYAPPAHDVVLLLHLVQTQEFRQKREKLLLHFYYDSLSEELTRNGVRPERVLPREVFLKSCDDYYDLGLLSSILYFQLILTPPAITSKFLSSPDLFTKNMMVDRSEMITECFKNDETFRSRMIEAMDDLVKRHVFC